MGAQWRAVRSGALLRGLGLGVVVIGLAGCQTGSLVQVQGACTASNPGYLGTWDCIRGRIAQNTAGQMNNDLGIRYTAVGDALAERVRARQMSDADAKLVLAQELSSANSQFEARRQIADAENDALIANGLAMMSPRSAPSFSPSISCTSQRFGNTLHTSC